MHQNSKLQEQFRPNPKYLKTIQKDEGESQFLLEKSYVMAELTSIASKIKSLKKLYETI